MSDWTPKPGDRVTVGDGRVAHTYTKHTDVIYWDACWERCAGTLSAVTFGSDGNESARLPPTRPCASGARGRWGRPMSDPKPLGPEPSIRCTYRCPHWRGSVPSGSCALSGAATEYHGTCEPHDLRDELVDDLLDAPDVLEDLLGRLERLRRLRR